jgi:3-oxoacyl-[acyl-carrier protein] reductase
VVVNGSRDRDAAKSVAAEARSHGVEALVAMGSVGSGADCARMAQEALAQFGTVDMLVNNAAIRPSKPFLEMTDEDWHSVMDVD